MLPQSCKKKLSKFSCKKIIFSCDYLGLPINIRRNQEKQYMILYIICDDNNIFEKHLEDRN